MSGLRRIARRIPGAREVYRALRPYLRRTAPATSYPGADSPFYHYNSSFDPIAVIERHAAKNVSSSPAHVTNYLGVRIDPKFFPRHLEALRGTIEAPPIPANWHADIAEWGAALRAVDLAGDDFTVIELGCGWGCWLNNTGVAARRRGKTVHLIGVEGDPGHIAFAKESCRDNGFSPDQVHIVRGIAAASEGFALFPRQSHAGGHWGLEPVFGATPEQRRAAAERGTHDELPMIGLAQLVSGRRRIDLLHIDIQGGEADLIENTTPVLNETVAYTVIGTHSRQIEGRLFDTLPRAGWTLEIERPAILALTPDGPRVTVDGVQGWRNPRLLPGPPT